MPAIKIEPHYKVTIPKETRDIFDLHIGEEVLITLVPKKYTKEGNATLQEMRAIKNGRSAYARGDSISLADYIRGVEASTHKARSKKSAKHS